MQILDKNGFSKIPQETPATGTNQLPRLSAGIQLVLCYFQNKGNRFNFNLTQISEHDPKRNVLTESFSKLFSVSVSVCMMKVLALVRWITLFCTLNYVQIYCHTNQRFLDQDLLLLVQYFHETASASGVGCLPTIERIFLDDGHHPKKTEEVKTEKLLNIWIVASCGAVILFSFTQSQRISPFIIGEKGLYIIRRSY